MNDTAQNITSLKDLASISSGYPLRVSVETLEKGPTPIVQLKNVDPETGIKWQEVDSITLPEGKKQRELSKSDIIFSSRGSRNFAYAMTGVPEGAVCAPQFLVLSLHNPDLINPEFLAWQLNQKPAQDYFERVATGSHILNIRKPAMESLPVSIPERSIQDLIVEIWRTAQKERGAMLQLIEARSRQLEAIAIGLFHPQQKARP